MSRGLFFQTNNLNFCKSGYEEVMGNLVKEANAINKSSLDYVLDNPSRNHIEMPIPTEIKFRFGRETEHYPMTRFAAYQLCQKTGLPPVYFERLMKSNNAEVRNLLCTSMNTLLKHHDSPLLFRTAKNCLRGVLTPQYKAFDTHRILDVFSSCFAEGGSMATSDIVFRGTCLSMDLFHVRFTSSQPVAGIPDKDIYYGMEIMSSDVGKYALSVRFFIYKQVCTNGMCLGLFNKKLYNQRHIGITADSFREGLRRSLNSFPELVISANDIIRKACAYDLSDHPVFDEYDKGREERTKVRQNLQKYLGVGEYTLWTFADIARERYDTSLWGYANAITEWSQRFSIERRDELETKAGNLLVDFDKIVKTAA